MSISMLAAPKTSLVVASRNQGKISEICTLLRPFFHPILSLPQLPQTFSLQDIPETGTSFMENAQIKARAVSSITQKITLADDSGLMVDALQGGPGVFSKRYGKNDSHRIQKLLQEMKGVAPNERTAQFVSAVTLFDALGQEIISFQGKVHGYITTEPRGVEGFGYDPVFYSKDLKKTFAEATPAEKNRASHRALALSKLIHYLEEYAVLA